MHSFFEDRAFQAAFRASVAVLMAVGAVLFVLRAWDIVEPLVVSVVLATALWPWVSRFADLPSGLWGWRIPRVVATSIVFVVTFSAAGLIIWVALVALLPEIDRGLAAYPDQTGALRNYLQPFRSGDIAGGASKLAGDVAKQAAASGSSGDSTGQSAPVNVATLALGLFGGFLQLGLVLVFTYFLLLEGERFACWLLRLLPPERRGHAQHIGVRVRNRISRWVQAQMIYGSVSGLVIWLAMGLLQLPSPWLYAVIGATLGIVPGLGPWIAMIPAFAVALGLSVWQATAVAVFGVAMYIVDSTTLSAKIYGEFLQLPMFVVLLALLVGALLMGVWGAVIAAPVVAGIQSILEEQMDRLP